MFLISVWSSSLVQRVPGEEEFRNMNTSSQGSSSVGKQSHLCCSVPAHRMCKIV